MTNTLLDMMEKPVRQTPTPFTVSQISNLLKETVEGTFSYVAVRGEISGCKVHTSGHIYFALKDATCVLDGVCWRGVASSLSVKPQDGVEVICYGKLTTYGARSKYQMTVTAMEHAGAGNLQKILNERREKLAKEGLFDEDRKKPLPFIPKVIGVVTSETGAVIKDILHRLQDRFPCQVILWPVTVQGPMAAGEVVHAINGFNALVADFPRPDVLIVARGGGSLEDLWAFNEEEVVRAVANSTIPVISAVGHETDYTLIDFVADRRAPTPTAAAEMAVPVRADLRANVLGMQQKLYLSTQRQVQVKRLTLDAYQRGLISPQRYIQERIQWLDDWHDRTTNAFRAIHQDHTQKLAFLSHRFRLPLLQTQLGIHRETLKQLGQRKSQALQQLCSRGNESLRRLGDLLEAYSYHHILNKGFALVRTANGQVVTKSAGLHSGDAITLDFADGQTPAVVVGSPPAK
jgi:exodeoxyribonuclease VII large subunit